MVLGRITSELITWIIPIALVVIVIISPFILLILFLNFLLKILTSIPILLIEYLEQKLHKKTIYNTPGSQWLKISKFLYSPKTQKEVFELIVADWHEEYFEALNKKENWKARWINVRYTYAFLVAMWQKSPIGDLIEFVTKIAK